MRLTTCRTRALQQHAPRSCILRLPPCRSDPPRRGARVQTSEHAARSEAMADIQRAIQVLDEKVNSLKADVAAINGIKEEETELLRAEELQLVPLAVAQVAQLNAEICEEAEKHWLHLARRLGADVQGV